jgi:geranylgeranyl reductase family protein
MTTVAILGGGPAGAFAAEQLCSQGVRAVLLDEKLAWEKPCGGGLTYKAYNQYPFLIDNDTKKKFVHQAKLAAPEVGSVNLNLQTPLLIYSRLDLNRMLLARAIQAGAEFEKTRVLSMEPAGSGWDLRTQTGRIKADYCIVATGARNPLRQVGTQLAPADTMVALGYYVPAHQDHVDIQFLAELEGYIWVFPRCGHLSVGICGKGEPALALRRRLENYMDENDLKRDGATFYSHLLPSLDTPSWQTNRVSGNGWMAVGDAAGLVDPITGEGLYYAMRSADLAVQALLSELRNSELAANVYRRLLGRDFAQDLEFGSRIAKRVFHGKVLFSSMPSRMVQFTRRSPRFKSMMQDLFAGTQDYSTLKQRLLSNLNGGLLEIGMSLGFSRIVPGGPINE